MFACLLLFTALLTAASGSSPAPIVRRIDIEGNLRIPAESILRRVSLIPGTPFDQARSEADLKRLYSLGVFEQVQVETGAAG